MKYLQLSLNMHALELPRLMHSLPLERECVDSSPRGVCVCVCALVDTLICRLNADLSINADLAWVLSTDMPVITTQFLCDSKGTATWTDGHSHKRLHTNLAPRMCWGANAKWEGPEDFVII